MSGDPWSILGIEPSGDPAVVRRAYAGRLKAIDPEADPAAFIELREAFEWAIAAARAGDAFDRVAAEEVSSEPIEATPDQAPEDRPAPAEHERRLAATEADIEAINRLHAMIFDPADASSAEEIAAQTETVLASPAMLDLDHGSRVEAFLSDAIVHGTPRSDAVIDPAARRFGWDREADALRRPPIVEWIAQRRTDEYFEIGLAARNRTYAALLARLRGAVPIRRPRWTAWSEGPRVEYLLAYLQSHHPTTLAGLDPEAFAWWSERIEEQHALKPPLGWLREWRRRSAWAHPLDGEDTHLRVGLYILIFVLPYVFVWLLLRAKHGWKERVVGFGYFGLLVFMPVMSSFSPPKGSGASETAMPSYSPPAEPQRFRSMAADLDEVIGGATRGAVTGAEVRERNAGLTVALIDEWEKARTRGDWSGFRSAANGLMEDVLATALQGDDRKLIRDHARSYASRLRWAARASADDCDGIIEGRQGIVVPADFADYQARLVGRALLTGATPGRRRTGRGRFTISADAFADARDRAGLDAKAFQASLIGGGTPTTRCTARIALIDAAVARGDEGVSTLRDLF